MKNILQFWPLAVIGFIAAFLALVTHIIEGLLDLPRLMNLCMGYFLAILALLKIYDLKSFAKTFAMYDIIAKRFFNYGYMYPFIEFALGLFLIFKCAFFATNLMLLILMTVSLIGVIQGVLSGRALKCACVGRVFNIPLSIVSIFENTGMGIMAALNIVYWWIFY